MLVGVAVSAVVINSVERFGVAQHAEPEQPRDHGDPLEIVAARQLGRCKGLPTTRELLERLNGCA
jgi:hypothetical protein